MMAGPDHKKVFTLSEAELKQLVAMVQRDCVTLATERHTDALMDGLCAEGAWDCAIDALRSQSPDVVLQTFLADQNSNR